MKQLNDYKLLIDADCPMCRIYGNGFEKIGLIEKGTCYPYQFADISITNYIDMLRAKNEIALINTKTNEVHYGIDAFRIMLSHSISWIDKFFSNKIFDWVLRRLYRFISYNRKVIAPSVIKANENDCIPSLNLFYRWLYILFVVFFSSFILYRFSKPINLYFGWESNYVRELLVCSGQIFWQTLFFKNQIQIRYLDYIGNLITVSLIGTILLLPSFLFSVSIYFQIFYSLSVVFFMLFEHQRRCKILEIGVSPSLSWVIYRLVVLIIIYFIR